MKLPESGEILYSNGKPICHVCGKSFHRLMTHARQKHDLTAYQYKKKFDLNTSKSITSEESAQKSREAVHRHPELIEALRINQVKTQFKVGSKGRTREQVSLQELKRIKSLNGQTQTPEMIDNCRRLGKSGIGNKVRWGNK
jgi:hypothetical protein